MMNKTLSPNTKNDTIGILCIILAGCLWGLGGIVGQYALQYKHVDTQWLIVVRMGVPGMILLSYCYHRFGREIFSPLLNRKEAYHLFILAIAGMWISQLTFYLCVKHSNAATATILQYLYPVIIAISLTIQQKRKPSLSIIVAIILSIVGAFLLATNGQLDTIVISRKAILFGLISAVTSAIYTLYSVPLLLKHNTLIVAGWSMIIGAFIANFFHPFWKPDAILDFQSWLAVLFIIFIGGMVGFILFLVGIKKIGSSKGSILSTVEPLATVIFSVFLFKITFTIADWVGTVCILMMILILSVKKPS